MDLLENPFHILKATPRDNRGRIVELAEERSLLLNPEKCLDARLDLTNPRKRLSMEIAWIPGLSPKNSEKVVRWLSKPVQAMPSSSKLNPLLSPLVRANILASGLQRLAKHNVSHVTKWILELARTFEKINPEDLCAVINEERIVSGFREVTNQSMVEAAIQDRRQHYRKVIIIALGKLQSKELIEVVTIAVEAATDDREEQSPILIDDLVDDYEDKAQAFFEKEKENIKKLLSHIKYAAESHVSYTDITKLVSKLEEVVKNWNMVALPIQVSKMNRGIDDEQSRQVANSIRDLAVSLHNEHQMLKVSQQLTALLKMVFEEVPEIAEQSAEDVRILNDLAEQRERVVHQEKKWKREITYETEIGALFKNKLRISPDGIEWKGRHWDLDAVTCIRWGAMKHYVNGIPTGTRYSIYFGNKTDASFVKTKRQEVYNQFVDRLWKAVGVRILTELLTGLRDGTKYGFGSAIAHDHGIELEKAKWIGNNEHIFCHWSDLVIWNGPGTFCIGRKENKKINVTLSYQENDNVHVLEAIIRTFWKQPGVKLSSLLDN